MLVNRCMELLNAKIAHAQTRHIARRVPTFWNSLRKIDSEKIQRERLKSQKYEASKRLSMWEQNREIKTEIPDEVRLDHSHYKHHGPNDRKYDCTWIEFPENVRYKGGPNSFPENQSNKPRRKHEKRQNLAKSWNSGTLKNVKLWAAPNRIPRFRTNKYWE